MKKPTMIPVRDSKKLASPDTAETSQIVIPMPTWTDSTSVAAWVTALIATANTVITLVHPGYVEPTIVVALVAPVSILVAAGAVIANIFRHSKVTAAAISR
jgi:hypothetical protein